TGGNQARYLECLYYEDYTETPLLSAIREILEEKGGLIAGTSAGAAVLSETMIQGGGSYGATLAGVLHQDINLANYEDNFTPFTDKKDGRVWIGKGFGFLPSHILSGTHFIARGRIGRLLTASLYLKGIIKKSVTGIGVDEDTAVFCFSDNTFEIIGALGALIIETSNSRSLKCGRGLSIHGENFVLHYLEHGDKFKIDIETGEIIIEKINEGKSKIQSIKNEKFYIEPDIFGRNTIRDFIQQCLINSDSPCAIGTELVDNTESSYDSILFHDLVKEDTILFRFTRNEKTTGWTGSVSYNWWGKGDRSFPKLEKVTENRFSFTNVDCKIIRMDVLNFPDMSDSSNIQIKSEYLKKGYSEQDWQELFDDYKNYRLGLLLLPIDKSNIEVHSFFFDYAYYDYDQNGRYSPPRYKNENESGKFQDYDIVQMNTAASTEIFIDGQAAGVTNNYGILNLNVGDWSKIKAIYHGKRNDYSVETENNGIRTAILVFEEIR
ncbi:MAG: cyanophycinase, partial [Bacteroidales bacterium]|nr:cyanophycinase [Bacteroidales bacterium]